MLCSTLAHTYGNNHLGYNVSVLPTTATSNLKVETTFISSMYPYSFYKPQVFYNNEWLMMKVMFKKKITISW